MDHFLPAQEAQDSLNLAAAVAFDARGIGRGIGDQTPPQRRAVGAAHHDRVAALKIALHRCHARGQQTAALGQGLDGAGVHGDGAAGMQTGRDPTLSRACGRGGGGEPGALAAVPQPGDGVGRAAIGDHRGAPRLTGQTGRLDLGDHAAAAHLAARGPGHGLDRGRDLRHLGDEFRAAIDTGVGAVQAADVRQKNQTVGADHARHPRCQTVVVAKADLFRGHGVVLVDHRHGAVGQQRR